MKKILLTFMLAPFFLFAQIEKGTLVAGSNLSINAINSTMIDYNGTNIAFTIAPNFGYAVKKNLVLGGNLSYRIEISKYTPKTSSNYPQSTNSQVPALSFFLKKYLMKGKFGGFVLWNTGISGAFYSSFYNNPNVPLADRYNRQKGIGLGTSISIGLTYFLSEHWALELQYGQLGYSFNHYFKPTNDNLAKYSEGNTHNAALGFTPDYLFFNLRYYFTKKQSKEAAK